MSEDKKIADELVGKDIERSARLMREIEEKARAVHGPAAKPFKFMTPDEMAKATPEGDTAVWFTIGERGKLTRYYAKTAGKIWKQLMSKFPRGGPPSAAIALHFLGYDEDPRELWEIEEVRKYVQRFAHFAGIDDAADHDEWLSPLGVALLGACGVPCSADVRLPPNTTAQ